MKANTVFVFFFIIFGLLQFCLGLFCKQGKAEALADQEYTIVENGECLPDKELCFAATCTAWDQPGNVFLYWGCAQSFWSDECIVRANVMQMGVGSANVSCECFRGETGVDWSNLKIALPPQSGKRLKCVGGSLDEKRNGKTSVQYCFDGYQFCYKAILRFWGDRCRIWEQKFASCWAKENDQQHQHHSNNEYGSVKIKDYEVIENWDHLKEKRSNTEYVNNVNNKNGQLFLAEFIGAAIKSAI
ncbi:hypothetical protein niasHS_008821 [Heterodera schachtii]|uniref:Uncharacterized protein n=1 Tax=Heterodera schachtii TaxID=97005 RepID=A0ABD2IVJ2_HETSC